MSKKNLCFLTAAIAIVLTSCSNMLYKDALHQGYMPENTQVSKLVIGMPEASVVALLGEPTLINPLYPEKWAYVELHSKNWAQSPNISKLMLTFKQHKLATIEKS